MDFSGRQKILLSVPIFVVARFGGRHRFREFSRRNAGKLKARSRVESQVTLALNQIFSQAEKVASKENKHILQCLNFSSCGTIGSVLEMVWNQVSQHVGAENARKLFHSADCHRGQVAALCIVSIQQIEDGPLAILSHEERFSWEYCNRLPVVPLHVVDVLPLWDRNITAVVFEKTCAEGNVLFQLHPGQVEAVLDNECSNFLTKHQISVHDFMASRFAVQQWMPLAFLLCKHDWKTISLPCLSRMPRSTPSELRAAVSRASSLYSTVHETDKPPVDFSSPAMFRNLAEKVRSWASMLLQGHDFDFEGQHFEMEEAVKLCDAQADALEQVLHSEPLLESYGRHGFQKRFKLVQLLRIVIFARDLKSQAHTQNALLKALETFNDSSSRGSVLSYLQDIVRDESISLPKKDVLYHMRFVVDLALMLYHREHLSSMLIGGDELVRPALYLMLDSSPQGGKNILNSEYDFVSGSDLLPLQHVWNQLVADLPAMSRLDTLSQADARALLDQQRDCVAKAAGMVKHHCNIPVALGSGCATVIHEYVALQHQFFMEAGSTEVLCALNASVVSTTTDRGVEKGMVNVPQVAFGAIFPYFTSQDELGFDVDFGADSFQPARVSVPEHVPAVYNTPPLIDANQTLSLQHVLDVGGAMHALSNISKGMLAAMPNYENHFYLNFNALVQFLHAPWQRDRFCQRCLTGSLEPLRALFSSFPWTLVKWRWLSLTSVVPELLLRKHALRAGWSAPVMGVRSSEEQTEENKDGYAPMNLELVSAAITSDQFWAWLSMLSILTNILK